MKTSEFIKKVEKLGYRVEDTGFNLYLYSGEDLVAFVGKKKQYVLEIYNFFLKQNAEALVDLCLEYAQTPIEEREEEEKFYLQKMKSFYDDDYNESRAFLNINTSMDVFCITNRGETSIFKTQFTQKEIDKIKVEQHTDLSEFKQIPVEEVEEE